MPYYSDPLLSALDSDSFATDASPMFNPPGKVDPAVLSSMRTVDFVGYAALPRHLRGRRNVITGRGPGGVRAGAKGRAEDRRRVGFPLFRSEREKEAAKRAANGIADDEGGDAAAGGLLSPGAQLLLSESNKDAMPAYYRKVEIQYSKFGVEDFDFA